MEIEAEISYRQVFENFGIACREQEKYAEKVIGKWFLRAMLMGNGIIFLC